MARYAYSYHVTVEDGEAVFGFPKFPEIISSVPADQLAGDAAATEAHAYDAVVTALQAIIASGDEIPEPDNVLMAASGFIFLSPLLAMKLQLYRVYLAQGFASVADFARRIGKQDTTTRRLLNLRHRSVPDEIEEVLAGLDIVIEHEWDVRPAVRTPAMTEGGGGRA